MLHNEIRRLGESGIVIVYDFIGFGILGYRSYGDDEIQLVGPMEKIHFLVGQNNVGKSNTLRFATNVLSVVRDDISNHRIGYPEQLDRPKQWELAKPSGISIGLRLTDNVIPLFQLEGKASGLLPLLNSPAYNKNGGGNIWLDFEINFQEQNPQSAWKPNSNQFAAGLKFFFGGGEYKFSFR